MSYGKESANRRRILRQGQTDPRPVQSNKKDTKRWCRGKVGVEHQGKCMLWRKWTTYPEGQEKRSYELVCAECSRRLDFYFPSLDEQRYPSKKPAWVTE
jgi:hypothetical protein